ncbi:TniQ family protein [Paraburkholderia nemoris]|uniref:TniQ family protein n=1 Tax=Paraburkholderia nemoris TaxID=2793076 RepID=UPI0038B88723
MNSHVALRTHPILLPLELDETIDSSLTRMALISGDRTTDQMALLLLGSLSVGRVMPRNLDSMAAIIGASDGKHLLQAHTIIPAYWLVLTEKPRDRILRCVSGTDNSFAIGVWDGSLCSQNRARRFCIECAIEDVKLLGFSYFRRFHRFSVIGTCPVHGVPLTCGCGSCRWSLAAASGKLLLPGSHCECGARCVPDQETLSRALRMREQRLGQTLAAMCRLPIDNNFSLDAVGPTLLDRLKADGVSSAACLMESLVKCYGANLIHRWGTESSHWAKIFFRSSRMPASAIRCAMLVTMLFDDVDEFVNSVKKYISTHPVLPQVEKSCAHYHESDDEESVRLTRRYKDMVRRYVREHPNATQKDVSYKLRSAAQYLRSYLPGWMQRNAPANPIKETISRDELDRSLYMHIIACRDNMLRSSIEPIRITSWALIKKFRNCNNAKHLLPKLPLSSALLDETVETIERYRCRRAIYLLNNSRHATYTPVEHAMHACFLSRSALLTLERSGMPDRGKEPVPLRTSQRIHPRNPSSPRRRLTSNRKSSGPT